MNTEKPKRSALQLANDKKIGKRETNDMWQAKNRIGKAFINRMRADFEKHGIATIEKVRRDKPEVYLNIVSRLIPQELNVNVEHSFTEVLQEAAQRYKDEKVINGEVLE